jgi:hypothetical protein
MSRQLIEALFIEGGPVEMATAILYFAVAAVLWFRSSQRAAAIMVLACGLRELDFHNRFTTAYVFNTRYFLGGKVPVPEMLVVLAVLGALGITLLYVLWNNASSFVPAIRAGETAQIYIAAGLGLMVFTVVLDRFEGFLRRSYFASTANAVFVMWIVEETLELFIPVLFLAAATVRPAADRRVLARRAAA